MFRRQVINALEASSIARLIVPTVFHDKALLPSDTVLNPNHFGVKYSFVVLEWAGKFSHVVFAI